VQFDVAMTTTAHASGYPATLPRVLAVEDDAGVVKNWRRLLTGRAIMSHAPTFDDAWRQTDVGVWAVESHDYVFLDLRLPDGDGEDLLDRLAKLHPRPGVAIVTGFLDARRALSLQGRCGIVVPKPADAEVLVGILALLEKARVGRSIVSDFANVHHLSPQETRLLLAAVRDATNDEASNELGCSPSTVRTYWTRILHKTRCRSSREVVTHLFRFALRIT
jgi:DNA-binding NarL/FixJ family response regulator